MNTEEKNEKKLFEERFKISTNIDKKYTDIYNNQGRQVALAYLKEIGAELLSDINYEIIYKLSQYTKNDLTENEKKDLLESLTRHKDKINFIKIFNKNNLIKILISTNEGLITAIKFSSISPKIIEIIPTLETSDRGGHCYPLAYDICIHMNRPSTIVTGYVYGYTNKSKFLHSWVEVTYNDADYVIDGTLNIMMDKKSYYRLKNAQPLSQITRETIISDIENYYEKLGTMSLHFYFMFRDEIINDFKKNQELFDNASPKLS